MKHLSKIITVIIAVCIALSLFSCGEGDAAGSPSLGGEEGSVQDTSVNRKIVYTVDMSIEVVDVSAFKTELSKKSAELGGYVETSSEEYDDGDCFSLSATYRIPTERLDEFISSVEGNGKVERKSVSTLDITTQYVNAEARKKALDERRILLAEMLEDPSLSSAERISVIDEISAVDAKLYEIELLISGYDSELKYSTVSVYVTKAADPKDAVTAAAITGVILVVVPLLTLITVLIVKKALSKKSKR